MPNSKRKTTQQFIKTVGKSPRKLNSATAKANSTRGEMTWHYGTVGGLGFFPADTAGGREVVIHWDGGPGSRKQGGIPDEQWELFKLSFARTGRVAILSDLDAPDWMFDYRFLEAQP
jgi:hypothetical protein